MRVLVLSSCFPNANEPTYGIFIRERISRLAGQCEVVVVAPVPWFPFNRWIRGPRATIPAVEIQANLTVYHPRFPSIPRYGKFLDGALYALALLPFVGRLRRTFPFDLIDAHFEFPDAVAAVLLGQVFRRPVVVTLRGMLVRLGRYRLHRPQLRWMLHRADRVTAVSDYLRRVAGGLGLPADRIRVIRNGVDTEKFSPLDRAVARRQCRLPADRRIVLTVAALYAHKGQHQMIAALPHLLERYPDLLYVMVGAGRRGESYARDLRALVQRLGLADHVRFEGPKLHGDLRSWFCAADLFVLLTQSEGWPNVLLESLACGVPVVATGVGGVPEVVRAGVDGLLIPLGDDPGLRQAVGQALERDWDREAILHYARSLDWTHVIELLVDEITGAIASRFPASDRASIRPVP